MNIKNTSIKYSSLHPLVGPVFFQDKNAFVLGLTDEALQEARELREKGYKVSVLLPDSFITRNEAIPDKMDSSHFKAEKPFVFSSQIYMQSGVFDGGISIRWENKRYEIGIGNGTDIAIVDNLERCPSKQPNHLVLCLQEDTNNPALQKQISEYLLTNAGKISSSLLILPPQI